VAAVVQLNTAFVKLDDGQSAKLEVQQGVTVFEVELSCPPTIFLSCIISLCSVRSALFETVEVGLKYRFRVPTDRQIRTVN
jgi:hypothetical protein